MSLIWFNKLLEIRNAEAGKKLKDMLDNLRLKNLLQHSSSSHAQGPYS